MKKNNRHQWTLRRLKKRQRNDKEEEKKEKSKCVPVSHRNHSQGTREETKTSPFTNAALSRTPLEQFQKTLGHTHAQKRNKVVAWSPAASCHTLSTAAVAVCSHGGLCHTLAQAQICDGYIITRRGREIADGGRLCANFARTTPQLPCRLMTLPHMTLF